MAMQTYVALLRGINVGGNKLVPMARLRETIEELGFEEVRTLLQSGNAVFRAAARATSALETALEHAIAERIDVECGVIVRSANQWRGIIAANPFTEEAAAHPSQLLVMALKSAPTAAAVRAVREGLTGPERVEAIGAEIFIDYPDGIGRSKLTGALIEKALGVRGTARNWNTVVKIGGMVS